MIIVKFGQPSSDIIQNPDLSGPILIALSLGCLLLMAGKIHFGDIYAMFILGNLLIYFLLNFISQVPSLSSRTKSYPYTASWAPWATDSSPY